MTHLAFRPPRPHSTRPTANRDDEATLLSGYRITLAGIGVLGGAMAGLFAVGGGIVMVPLLMWRAGMDQRRATATSLVAIVPSALVGSLTYLVNGEVDLTAASFVMLGAVAGTMMGTRLLHQIPVSHLRWMLVVFLLLVAVRLLLVSPERGGEVEVTVAVALAYMAVGLVMGLASGLFGIGGGVIAVPLMVSVLGVSDLVAKGTSLLVSVPTTAVGTMSNRHAGLVDLRAGLVVGIAAAAASVPAAVLSLHLPARLSGQLFAGVLVLVAIQMILRARREQAIS